MVHDSTIFDAHTAVMMLHRYRDNPVAVEVIIDRLTDYAEHYIDDVEFYIQQIVHLVVNLELAKTDKVVNLLLSICKAKTYVEHFGQLYSPCAATVLAAGSEDCGQRPTNLLMQWMEKERQKRYKYFHEQREFIKALTDISEQMRLIDPPQERKRHLPAALEALPIPAMAYIPLGRVSDPFCRVTRVLKDEGTVFSTHSRAPCLVCFEVIEDQINAAGHRHSMTKAHRASSSVMTPRPSGRMMLTPRGSTTSVTSSVASFCDEEAEVAGYIKKFGINGKYVSLNDQIGDHSSDRDSDEDIEVLGTPPADEVREGLERLLNITISQAPQPSPMGEDKPSSTSPSALESHSTSAESRTGDASVSEDEAISLIRRRSKAAYDTSLARILSEGGAFGESWKAKKERIRASSPFGQLPGWNVISLISKSNDDIRQEVFAMQLISKFQDIFHESNLPLWLRPYRIVSTGRSTGLIETITDAPSLDSLKKREGYQDLRTHFERTHGGGDVQSRAFKTAQRNFLHSLVAYSIVTYLLQIKDRHNGNILLDTEGHIIHIDFGFMLGIAPGGTWSLETAPFKLTKEMVQVLGGTESKLFGEFVQLFVLGMLAAQRNAEKIITLVEIMMRNSTFPCFQGRDVSKDLQKLRDRFLPHSSTEQIVKTVMKMIEASYKNKWTKRYDQFQKLTNGIMP
ncbi:hypothetical protein PINS_up019976 [Pythium insidiosum]|nr:hypothetical protein PINS_up019976 [Pythium insidiosum]